VRFIVFILFKLSIDYVLTMKTPEIVFEKGAQKIIKLNSFHKNPL